MVNKKTIIYFIIWVLTIFLTAIWTFENPDKVELVKNIYKKDKKPISEKVNENSEKVTANSFDVNFEKIISLSHKTSFVLYEDSNLSFDQNLIKIFTQNGYLISNSITEKINLPKTFTLQRNGGLKTIFTNKKNIN